MWLFLLPFITLLDSWNSVCNLRPQIRSVSHLFPIIPLSGLESHLELSTESGPGPLQAFWLAGLAKSCNRINKMLWKNRAFDQNNKKRRRKRERKETGLQIFSSPFHNNQISWYNGRLDLFAPINNRAEYYSFKSKMLSIEDSIWEKSVILLQSAMYFFCCIWNISSKSCPVSDKIQFLYCRCSN